MTTQETITAQEFRKRQKARGRARRTKPVSYIVPIGAKSNAGAHAFLEIELPIRIEPEMNLREHWRARHRRATAHDEAVFFGIFAKPSSRDAMATLAAAPSVSVTFTRLAPRATDDDNERGGWKFVRDSIARLLGKDDADPRINWIYAEPEKSKQYGARVRIEVTPRGDSDGQASL